MRNKKVLITGGTGTVGKALVAHLLNRYPDIGKIVIYSRDEQKHFSMAALFPPEKYSVQFVLGDVRDRERIMMACRGIDVIIHAAAMKHVPVSEHNPIECAKTNILGTQNVIDAAVLNDIERVVALSSDKAVSPINAYGASKLYLERLILDANRKYATKFSIVRYANVFGSKGSVIPFFLAQKKQGFLPITHPRMTRFSITMQESLELVLFAVEHGWGGEIIVPISSSYRILDVAEAVAPGIEQRIVGIRPGEKLHETMIGLYESAQTVRLENRYILCSNAAGWDVEQYCSATGAVRIEGGFDYESSNNNEWLTVEQIRKLISDGF
ncbi:MAG: SDR family NAD(P)-dependent oxidoreductase [Candidatus Electrothrix communis]|nr:MAG: SDR family NAD(P)-dependent oxidoreductase [Candidatus Electrothrix communis]